MVQVRENRSLNDQGELDIPHWVKGLLLEAYPDGVSKEESKEDILNIRALFDKNKLG